MGFILDMHAIKGKTYKKIFSYLCDVSDIIYFTYYDYEDMMINDEIFELSEQCRRVEVPRRIRDLTDRSVIGYQIDIFIRMYLFEKEDTFNLFADREWGEILFCKGEDRIAYIQEDDWGELCIQTDEEELIKELSKIKS